MKLLLIIYREMNIKICLNNKHQGGGGIGRRQLTDREIKGMVYSRVGSTPALLAN